MLTKLEFRQRFTLAERVAINLAAVDNPALAVDHPQRVMAATLRVFLDDLASAEFVEVTYPDTVAGVQQLEQFGLIAPGRAAQILAPSGQPSADPAQDYALVVDTLIPWIGLRVGQGGTYAAADLVPCYRDGDETKTPVAAYPARYIATGEN